MTAGDQRPQLAATALAEAAGVVLDYPRDPAASGAEAQFEQILELLLTLHWRGEGDFDGLVHRGFERRDGRVRLDGAARVLEGPDRQVRVDVSPITGGTVIVDRPAPKRRRLLSFRGAAPALETGATQLISIPPSVITLDPGDDDDVIDL